jgi:hypothetical protein
LSQNKPKKAPNALETTELLDLLEQAEEAKEPEAIQIVYKNDVLTFLSVFNIQSGEDNVKSHTLYSIYKVWSKDPLSKSLFLDEVTKYVTRIDTGYKINQNAIKLTHEAYSKFKQENRKLKSKPWTKHFQDFLAKYELKSEDFWLEAPILYFIYDKYAHERKLDENINTYMGKTVFYTYADLFLKYKKTKTGKVYAVSPNILNQFQPDQYDRMVKAHKKEQIQKDKPKKKRKKRARNSTIQK